MIYSKSFIKTLRETPRGAQSLNQILLERGSFISQIGSGIFAYLPLGLKVAEKLEQIIRENLEKIGVQEVSLPLLHPAELWKRSGRFQEIGEELVKISTEKTDEFVLAMTHEEVITEIAKIKIQTDEDLPLILGQISKKIRNEVRPRGGLIRLKEFQMQDAYSFHVTEEELEKTFQDFIKAYQAIFERVGLEAVLVEADPGMMGGSASEEFMLINPAGEDKIFSCPKCVKAYNNDVAPADKKCPADHEQLAEKRAIELAHVFKLGSKYSEKLGLNYHDKNGQEKPVLMGCYGLGLDRLMGAIVEGSHDEKGIIWPKEVAPAEVYLIDLEGSRGQEIYDQLVEEEVEVLFDDREVSPGIKFADADLLGIPYRIVISKNTLKENKVELKRRNSPDSRLIEIDKISLEIK